MAFDRRGFLKFIAGGAAGTLLTPIPWKLTDDASIWSQNWPWIPRNISGPSKYVPTVSKLCPSGCGIMVRTVGGQPVRTVGNPDHPLSQGKFTSLAAAEVQLLYSPARLKRPLKKTSDGSHVAISWEEAIQLMAEKCKEAGSDFACLSGDETGTVNELLSALVKEAGSDKFYILPGELTAAAKAWYAMGGTGQPGYDFESADYVLALGADILESWGTVVRNRRVFADTHPHAEEPTTTFAYIGPVENNTATGADTWMPAKPGTQAVVALGLANLLIKQGASCDAADFAAFQSLAAKYTPEKVAELSGVSPDALKQCADALAKARKPLIVAGSEAGQGAGAATVIAGLALNMLVGGAITDLPAAAKALANAMDTKDVLEKDFMADIAKKAPKVLMTYEANPVYALPGGEALAEALKDTFLVSFTSFLDETAMASDLVLPVPMGLERYDDVNTPYGCGQIVYSLAVPVAQPLTDAGPTGDSRNCIIAMAKAMGKNLGVGSFRELLEKKAAAMGADMGSLEEGEAYTSSETAGDILTMGADVLGKAMGAKKAEGYPLALAPVAKLNFGTRYVATPPFNLKTIRDDELAGTESFVAMNGATAQKLGLAKFAKVSVQSATGAITARVNITEGVMDDVVAAPLGLGHTAFDQYTKDKGENLAKLFTATAEPGTGLPVWADTMVKIAKI